NCVGSWKGNAPEERASHRRRVSHSTRNGGPPAFIRVDAQPDLPLSSAAERDRILPRSADTARRAPHRGRAGPNPGGFHHAGSDPHGQRDGSGAVGLGPDAWNRRLVGAAACVPALVDRGRVGPGCGPWLLPGLSMAGALAALATPRGPGPLAGAG